MITNKLAVCFEIWNSWRSFFYDCLQTLFIVFSQWIYYLQSNKQKDKYGWVKNQKLKTENRTARYCIEILITVLDGKK